MTGIVIDTNVVVSALLKPRGAEADVLRFALNGRFKLYVSEVILQEYEGVARRPKFKRPDSVVTALLDSIRSSAELLMPTQALSVSKDESDNRFLELAEKASADYLVTGNKRHFPKRWKSTDIVSARTLLQLTMPPEH